MTPSIYYRLGNDKIVMVIDGGEMQIALVDDSPNAADSAFPFFAEDFNAKLLGTFSEIILNQPLKAAYDAMAESGALLRFSPLTIVRTMYALVGLGGKVTAQQIELLAIEKSL